VNDIVQGWELSGARAVVAVENVEICNVVCDLEGTEVDGPGKCGEKREKRKGKTRKTCESSEDVQKHKNTWV
jgi:hypothetical protein